MRRAILPVMLLTGLASSWPGPAPAQDCPHGTKKIGEQETESRIIVRPVCRRMTAAEMQARIAELDARRAGRGQAGAARELQAM